MSESVENMRKKFCFGDYTGCARYQVMISGNYVPDFLSPYDAKLAHDLIYHEIRS